VISNWISFSHSVTRTRRRYNHELEDAVLSLQVDSAPLRALQQLLRCVGDETDHLFNTTNSPCANNHPQMKLECSVALAHDAEQKVKFLLASTQSPLEIPALVSELEKQVCLMRAPGDETQLRTRARHGVRPPECRTTRARR